MTGATMERKRKETDSSAAFASADAELDDLLEDANLPNGTVSPVLPAEKLGALLHLHTQAVEPALRRRAD